MGRKRRLVLGAVTLACLAAPATGQAHFRSGTVAVDYRATVRRPSTSAYSAQILESDRALSLRVKRGHTVVLLGYLDEPVFRLDRAGLWVNAASPTAAGAGLLTHRERVAASTPIWSLQRGRHSVVWHDARTRGLPAGTTRGVWLVPVLVDGRRTRLSGELWRYPAPQLWPWVGLLGGLLAAAVLPLAMTRSEHVPRVAAGLAGVSTAGSVLLAFSFALDRYASPGTWIEGVDGSVLLAVGVGILLFGPRPWRFGAAIGVGLLGLALGLSKGAVFFHPIALAIVPATVVRWASALAIGTGCGAAWLGCWIYAHTPEPLAEPPAVAALRAMGGRPAADVSAR